MLNQAKVSQAIAKFSLVLIIMHIFKFPTVNASLYCDAAGAYGKMNYRDVGCAQKKCHQEL